MAQDLPQTMVALDGMGFATDKSDPRAQGQITAAKVEHWMPVHSTSNAGDVVYKAIERLQISCGVVDGVPEHVLAAKRGSTQNGVVIEYQLGIRLNGNTSRKAKQGDELPLPPQTPLIRCFDDHQLVPIRRSPKADVASMPPAPEYVFYLRKSVKSIQAEIMFEQEQEQHQASSRRAPAPLQAQALRPSDNDSLRSPVSPTGTRSLRSLHSIEDLNGAEGNANPGSPGQVYQARVGSRNANGAGSPSSQPGPDGNIRIPRRMESAGNPYDSGASTGRPSPTLMQQQGTVNSRTPTPDQVSGRNRSPSVGQVGNELDASRSTTPERPARAERQRATSPHGPSPLSLATVMLSKDNHSSPNAVNGSAPMNVKKNSTQGTDVVMDRGVIRSSRLMNSKQYRYSFIPKQGGEEVDISDILEDILGEEGGYSDEDDGELQHLDADADVAASANRDGGRTASQPERSNGDRLEILTSTSRGGNTLMRLEKVLVGDLDANDTTATSPAARSQLDQARQASNRSTTQHRKRDSDVEIQVASVASITTRSTSPMITDSSPGSPRTHRPTSPGYGVMTKPTLLSNTGNNSRSSPLKENNSLDSTQDGSATARSFSPLPRRLQSPSPALKQSPSGSSLSPSLRPSSPAGGRESPVSARSGSPSSITSARNRSASASAAESQSSTSRLAHLTHNSNNSSTTSLSSSASNMEWLLTSDYNAGMQDLLTLVRAGRSSSMSSAGAGLGGLGGMRPFIGKDGKIVALPSTIKASILNGGIAGSTLLSRSRTPSLNQLHSQFDAQRQTEQDKNTGDDSNKQSTTAASQHTNDSNSSSSSKDEQTKMMLMMLNELTLQDVKQDCHPDVYDCWKDVDADLDRVERVRKPLFLAFFFSVSRIPHPDMSVHISHHRNLTICWSPSRHLYSSEQSTRTFHAYQYTITKESFYSQWSKQMDKSPTVCLCVPGKKSALMETV